MPCHATEYHFSNIFHMEQVFAVRPNSAPHRLCCVHFISFAIFAGKALINSAPSARQLVSTEITVFHRKTRIEKFERLHLSRWNAHRFPDCLFSTSDFSFSDQPKKKPREKERNAVTRRTWRASTRNKNRLRTGNYSFGTKNLYGSGIEMRLGNV